MARTTLRVLWQYFSDGPRDFRLFEIWNTMDINVEAFNNDKSGRSKFYSLVK